MSRLALIKSHLDSDRFVSTEKRGGFGILTLLHRAPPPARDAALTSEMRRSLLRGLRALQADEEVKMIILTSDSPRVFSSGVNREAFADALVEDADRKVPSLAGLCQAVESSSKLVIAYICGACESWGLELALAAPFRIAFRSARFSFPEVQLSLVPCGGGAQRLTRLIGVRQALLMLCTGKTVTAAEAKGLDLVHEVVDEPGLETVLPLCNIFAAKFASFKPYIPRARRTSRLGLSATNAVHFAWVEHKIRDHAPRKVTAPYKCVEAVRIAARNAGSFDLGVEQERSLFLQCMTEPECKAMQHVLRASARTLTNWDRRLRSTLTLRRQLLPFDHAAVIGAGTIGTSIAFLLLQHGLRVTIVELDAGRRKAVMERLTAEINAAATAYKRLSLVEAKRAIERLSVVGSNAEPYPDVLGEVDLVVECVPESAETKKNLFSHLDKVCNASCVFLSSTASFNLRELAAATQRPQQVVGMQFYPPANMNPLVEVCRTDKTDTRVLLCVMALAEKLQKHVVLTSNAAGHAGTRILLAGLYQAHSMLEEGCFPFDIDNALKRSFCFKHGILELEDMMGLDAIRMARQHMTTPRVQDDSSWSSEIPVTPLMPRRVFDIADSLVGDGLVGRKRGQGWYAYKEMVVQNPDHDAKDEDVPLGLPSLYNSWNPLTWRSGQTLPVGQWQALLASRDVTVVRSRPVELRVLKVCKEKGIRRRDVAESEIVERILLAMVNEAAKLLSCGAASCAADIDCLSVLAFGFPAWKGGLLCDADQRLGIDTVITRMNVFRNSSGEDVFPAPCSALLEMQQRQQKFATAYPATGIE